MRYLLILILSLSFALAAVGQDNKIPQAKLDDAKTIAELYYALEYLGQEQDFFFWSFDYEADSLKIFNEVGQLKSNGLITDSLPVKRYCNEAPIWDSTVYKKYYGEMPQSDIRTKRFELAAKIIHLMEKNGFLSISNGGVGDCFTCSVKIVYEWDSKKREGKGFVLELHSWCADDDCYNIGDDVNAKLYKLEDNIYLIKNTTYFGGHYCSYIPAYKR